ncbi:MAG: cytochrome c oxidase subunit I [bacterium]|nr:cytochrome c oxidase subunit I [bacterium]
MTQAKSNENEKESSSFLTEGGRYKGLLGWIFSTDHKRIGILYLVSIITFFAVGLAIGLLMRLELIAPGHTIVKPDTYNAFFTLHGMVMIFLFIIPGIPATLGNFFLPIQIGAPDVAFPRLNLLSWWLFIIGAVIAVLSIFTGGGTPDTGWTFYAPYSIKTDTNVTMAVFGAFIMGFSSILTGLNFIVTIHRMRTKGMRWFRMPLFAWAHYATAWIQVLATPILSITLLLVVVERMMNLGLFDAARGGDPLLYQHLFWIYSHPAVYIMILPAMGVVSEIIPCFARKNIYGYKAIVFSSMSIAFFGYLVWGHHMYTSGMSDTARWIFSLLTFLVAIPSGVKVFNWVATLYKGSIKMEPPMLFTFTFIFLFAIGGLTGLVNGALATDVHIHDTAFVVGHFHYVMFGGTGFALMAGLLYWLPKMSGRMYNKKLVFRSWYFLFFGFNLLFFSMLVMGWLGMPRRYYDYLPRFQPYHLASTIGSWLLAVGLIMFAAALVRSWKRGKPAGNNPWGASTLEWQTSSPPPLENFHEAPVVEHGPYNYDGGTD